MSLFLLICGLNSIEVHTAVRLIKESIPSFAIKGEDLLLECLYDLEGDTLYSVKWYKNGQEFYRHIPSDNPKTVVFGQPGLDIDEYKSTDSILLFHNVDLTTGGRYKCEVSGEAPHFQTATHTNLLFVVDLPDEGPIISGTKPAYKPGDVISANCTSHNSFPVATLNWYVNGQAASDKLLHKFGSVRSGKTLTTKTLGLRLRARSNLFSGASDLKLKCTATIEPLYWKSSEEAVQILSDQSSKRFLNSAPVRFSSSSQLISLSISISFLIWLEKIS